MVDAVLADYRMAPIEDREKALFGFVEKVNRNSTAIGPADTEALLRAGWSDEAIYDAINVCGLFNFYNRWIDAAGVHAMPEDLYAQAGERMAKRGYVPPEEIE